MESFVLVADTGSFTAAAARLGVRQPTISRRVAELEEELGTALLLRSTRSLALTEAGHRYLERARDALASVVAAREAATGSPRLTGSLHVAAPLSFTHSRLAPRLPAFVSAHPDLQIDLQLAEHHPDLVASGIDVALRLGEPEHPALDGRRLLAVQRTFVASPAWCEGRSLPLDAAAFSTVTGLQIAAPGTRPRSWRGTDAPAPARLSTATSGQPLRELALAGVGVALVPDWLVLDDLERGDLVRVSPPLDPPSEWLWVLWPAHRFRSAAARTFVDWVFAEFHCGVE